MRSTTARPLSLANLLVSMTCAVGFLGACAGSSRNSLESAPIIFSSEATADAPPREERVLLDLTLEHDDSKWKILDDRLMLGSSKSTFLLSDSGTGVFEGTIKNSWDLGWATARRTLDATEDLSSAEGVTLRVLGDGKTYAFNLRNDKSRSGVYYEAKFKTIPNEWQDVFIPLSAFTSFSMGKPKQGADPFDPTKVWSYAFVVGWDQTGPFRLEIGRIAAAMRSTDTPPPTKVTFE